MRKLYSHSVLVGVIFLILSNPDTTWANTIKEAKMTEIEAILIKAQNQLEIAEKELSYAQKTQNRIKEKNLSDYQEIVQHTRETLETAMTDIGEINDSIDDFLGITYGSTRPDGI